METWKMMKELTENRRKKFVASGNHCDPTAKSDNYQIVMSNLDDNVAIPFYLDWKEVAEKCDWHKAVEHMFSRAGNKAVFDEFEYFSVQEYAPYDNQMFLHVTNKDGSTNRAVLTSTMMSGKWTIVYD